MITPDSSLVGPKATFAHIPVIGPAMAPTLRQVIPRRMPESLAASVDETDQRCLIVRAGAAAAGAVACLDILPVRLATLVGVRGRRAIQNDSTASATAALTSA